MSAQKARRVIYRKKLCLKSTLDTCKYDPVTNTYYKDFDQTMSSKQATEGLKAGEVTDDSLEDFKSPEKAVNKVKSNVREPPRLWLNKPYRYPDGCCSTQDMFAFEWGKPRANKLEYLSEDEFEEFQDKKKREALLLSKLKYRNLVTSADSAPLSENTKKVIKKSISFETPKHVSVDPVPQHTNNSGMKSLEVKASIENSNQKSRNLENTDTSTPSLESAKIACLPEFDENSKSNNINISLRSELRRLKVNSVIINDSGESEDEVLTSQLVSYNKLKNHVEKPLDKNGELKSSHLKATVNEVFATPESTSITACNKVPILVSIPLKVLTLIPKKEIQKSDSKRDGIVVLYKNSVLQNEKVEFHPNSSFNLQHDTIQCMQNASSHTNPAVNPLIEVQATKSGWRVKKMTTASNKPSKQNSKNLCCKKSKYSYIRTLRWKIMRKRKVLL